MNDPETDSTGKDIEQADNVRAFPADGRRPPAETRRSDGLVDERLRAAGTGDEPVFNLPPATKTLCLAFLAIQGVMSLLPDVTVVNIITNFGFVPARYMGSAPFDMYALISPLTSMFLHGGWLHVSMNVGMMMAFGTGLEREIGTKRTLILFFASGILGALVHAAATDIFNPFGAGVPLIGASGGISGLFGAMMMMLYERGVLGAGYMKLVLIMAVWVLVSVFFGYFGLPGETNSIAWVVHVAGFAIGLGLYRKVIALKI